MTDHDAFLNQPWDFRLVMEAYDMIATYNSLERETTGHGSARSINVFRQSPRLAAKRATFKVRGSGRQHYIDMRLKKRERYDKSTTGSRWQQTSAMYIVV